MSRKEEAYQYLKSAILSNQLKGDTPISELAIAEELKMSRSPIREAMRKLESEGLIVSYPSRGSFVSSISPYDLEEIYELRILLEEWALGRSFEHISAEELNELERKFSDALEKSDWELIHTADRDLHRMIVERASSKRLQEFINILNVQIERVRHISAQDFNRVQISYKEHMEIIQNMKAGNLEASREALRNHLRSVADSAIEVVKYRGNV